MMRMVSILELEVQSIIGICGYSPHTSMLKCEDVTLLIPKDLIEADISHLDDLLYRSKPSIPKNILRSIPMGQSWLFSWAQRPKHGKLVEKACDEIGYWGFNLDLILMHRLGINIFLKNQDYGVFGLRNGDIFKFWERE